LSAEYGRTVSSANAPVLTESETCRHEEVLARVGQMTRTLHDSLRALGLDNIIQKAAYDIPNARDRLQYVARMTEQAAQKVLNATDAAMPLQDKIDEGADALIAAWQGSLLCPFSEDQYRLMADRTLVFLDEAKNASNATKQHLLDIMMAQDFQDLTGQVIKKITEVVHDLEQKMVQLLVDYAPPDVRREVGTGMINGPQINAGTDGDAIVGQEQVDDLLGSLGF